MLAFPQTMHGIYQKYSNSEEEALVLQGLV